MKTTYLIFLLTLLIFACGGNDKQARLKELQAQRDNLTTEIEALRSELSMENLTRDEEIKKVVKLKQVNSSLYHHFVKIQGTVESDNNILVPSRASGVVKKILVTEGQLVKKGQLLAELDGAIYERTIAELKTNLELATTIFERQKRLWNKKIGSEVQYLQTKTNKESLEQRLATTHEQYLLTKIKAPISGSVDQILIKENEAAAAGFGAIRVVKLSDLKITANLSEVYQGKVKINDPVGVFIPNFNRSFDTDVSSVSQVIDPKNRTFIVEINVPKDQIDLKPNMMVRLSINDYSNQAALTVPLKTIQKTGDMPFLFTAKKADDSGNKFWIVEKRFVRLGTYNEKDLEIQMGLKDGEFVVTEGFQDLSDRQKVRLADSEQADSKK